MKLQQVQESKVGQKLIYRDLEEGQWFNWEGAPSPCIKITDDLYFNVRTGRSSSGSIGSAGRVLLVDGNIFWHVVDEYDDHQ